MTTLFKNAILKNFNVKRKLQHVCLLFMLVMGTFQSNAQTYLISVGSDIYEVDPLTCTETFLCSIVVNTGGGTISSTVHDIALHPNGNLYAIVSNYFISIDLTTCSSTTIATHSTGANSLVAAADGTLYAASSDLYTVDPVTGVFTSLGTVPCQSGGDLAFESGDLYLTCLSGDLLKVDINNPAASTVVGNLGAGNWFGLWTVYTDCDNTQILVASESDLYEVDINTAMTTYSCSLGTTDWIAGATMQGDFNASECGCSVDLGPDQDLCNGPVELNAGGSNYTYLWNDGSMDSTLSVSIPGTYYVSITDTTDGCTSSDTITVTDCELGLLEMNLSFEAFPNPSDGHLTIRVSDFSEMDIILADVTGRLVYRQSNLQELTHLDLSDLMQGTYFLSLVRNGRVLTSTKVELVR